MHQRHSPAGVMRRHRTTARHYENQTLWLVWTVMFFISPLRAKNGSTRDGDCGPTEHRRLSARNGEHERMLLLLLYAKGEAPPSPGLRFRHHMIVHVQAIYSGDDIVEFVRVNNTDGIVSVRRVHDVGFLLDHTSQRLARELSPESDEKILADIAARKAAEAAVPSPRSFIRRPRAWLSHMPCACMFQCRKPCRRCFCAQLARFAIAQCQS
jgi:hypothetical protein